MAKVKNIVFDFGGVLARWDMRYYYRDYFRDDAKMEFFLANVCTTEWNTQNDCGRTYDETTSELIAEWPEYADAIRMFPMHWGEMLGTEIVETTAVVRRLNALGYRTFGLTNWSAQNIHVAYERFVFPHLFEGVVVSGIERTVKPFPRIYRILLSRYNLAAEESVFVDDNAANVAGAERVGMHGILFRSTEQAAAEIAAWLGIAADSLLQQA